MDTLATMVYVPRKPLYAYILVVSSNANPNQMQEGPH